MPRTTVSNQPGPRGKRISLGIIFRSAWRWSCRVRHEHFYLLIEFQSDIDAWMAVRTQVYQGLLWQQVIDFC